MKFTELESYMLDHGVTTLANIARELKTTPQAVSNWKSRDQVPHHVVIKLNQSSLPSADSPQSPIYGSPSIFEEDKISFFDILLVMAEQLKVIVLITFISAFVTFTYVQFIQVPMYASNIKVFIPSSITTQNSGFAGLANQFGVNIPSATSDDLSNPSLFPELLQSRTFAEKVLDKEFFTEKYGKKLKLLSILTHGDKPSTVGKDTLVTMALGAFKNMVAFSKSRESKFSNIRVVTNEPVFSRDLAKEILIELEKLNRYYKNKAVNEKIKFIEQRILTIIKELESSEQQLKEFNENNQQILSPTLRLQVDRLERDVDVSKNVYLTLKQEYELAKIEEIQKSSIVQVVDPPQIPLKDFNIHVLSKTILAISAGLTLGFLIAFIRKYFKTDDMDNRKKFRRIKNFINKKLKDLLLDSRVAGIISVLFLLGLPTYLGRRSDNPEFFGMYSKPLMIVNTVYVLTLMFFIVLFIYLIKRKKNSDKALF